MKKIIIPGFVIAIVMLIFSLGMGPVTNFLFPGVMTEYQNPQLFRAWTDPLMSLYFLHPFLVGFILAWIWNKTKPLFKHKIWWQRGICFGLIYWLTTIPGMFISYASFPISLAMTISWSLSLFVQAIAAGKLLAKMNP